MTRVTRRHFLQGVGSTLAAIGLSQADFLHQAEGYGRVLAQSTPRKLALLVGINDYSAGGAPSLNGCETDVELQKQVLMHRFGFNAADIVTLTSQNATRDTILTAFEEHLIQQAKPGDVVVFHFSGHGSLVTDPHPLDTPECRAAGNCDRNGTLVPNDPLPTQNSRSELVVPDIMGRTLFLLMDAVPTENLTVVLDSCYSGAGTRGNVRVRSATRETRGGRSLVASETELAYQEALLAKYNVPFDDFQQRRQDGIAKGIALGSARRNQEALDASFANDIHAGAFTYILTRYLWQLPSQQRFIDIQANLRRSTRAEASLRGYEQEPIFEAKPNSGNERQPFYFSDLVGSAADAVITAIQGDQVEFWLGGVSSQTLTATNIVFDVLDATGRVMTDEQGEAIALQQNSRAELYGYGRLLSGQLTQLQPGLLLREKIVGFPANPTLTIKLDPSLQAQTEAARQALQTALLSAQGVNRLTVISATQPGAADYFFGYFTAAYQQQLTLQPGESFPPINSLGLFTPTLTPLSGSFGRVGESVETAVNRLLPKLKLLLAGKVLQSIAATSSELQITGEIFAASSGTRVPIVSRGASNPELAIQVTRSSNQPFRAGEAIQFKVDNRETQEMYLSCLAIDSSGNLIVLYPANWDLPEEASRIDRNSSLVVPRPEDGVEFRVQGAGLVEILTLVSTNPLRNALRGLQAIARSRGVSRGYLDTRGDEPLDVVTDLLGDLDGLSRSRTATIGAVSTQPDQRSLSTNTLAAFSTVIEIVE